MYRRKHLKENGSACCLRKFFDKAFHRRKCQEPYNYQQEELVYLSLYLASLEKKMRVIEEMAAMKWNRQRVEEENNTEGRQQQFIKSVPSRGQYDKLSIVNYSETVIEEILSLGEEHFERTSRKWSAMAAPAGDQIEMASIETDFVPVYEYHVGARCWPAEVHTARTVATARQFNAAGPVKATCSVKCSDVDGKTIEITYQNQSWDKSGTIVLEDIDHRTELRSELLGRVVCFLLGMSGIEPP